MPIATSANFFLKNFYNSSENSMLLPVTLLLQVFQEKSSNFHLISKPGFPGWLWARASTFLTQPIWDLGPSETWPAPSLDRTIPGSRRTAPDAPVIAIISRLRHVYIIYHLDKTCLIIYFFNNIWFFYFLWYYYFSWSIFINIRFLSRAYPLCLRNPMNYDLTGFDSPSIAFVVLFAKYKFASFVYVNYRFPTMLFYCFKNIPLAIIRCCCSFIRP